MVVAARYLNRELLLVLIAVTAVLLAVTVGGRFISYLQEAALGKYSADSIVRILLFRMPGFLQLLLPFAWSLALLLTLGRLHAESELVVLRGGGVGPGRLLTWLTPLAVGVAVLVGCFSMLVAPANDRRLSEFIREQRANPELNTLTPGVFNVFSGGRRVTYADAVSEDGRGLDDVFMAEFGDGNNTVTLRARTGRQRLDEVTGTRYLELENGHRYQGSPGQPDYQVVSFSRLVQRLDGAPPSSRFGIETEATADLWRRSDPEARAELHFRVALPLVVLIGSLVAVGVSRTRPREGRFARIVPGLGLFVLYYAALVFNRNAISDGQLPIELGMWVVHAGFLLTGVLLLRQSSLPAKV